MPFVCKPVGYLVSGVPSKLSQIDLVTGVTSLIGNLNGDSFNAIGYNTLDNYIYGMDNTPSVRQPARIDSDGTVTLLGNVLHLPSESYPIGTMDLDGHLFLFNNNTLRYYVIDLKPGSPNYLQLVDPTAGFILATAPYGNAVSQNVDFLDWAFDPITNLLYTVASSSAQVYIVNPYTGVATLIPLSNVPAGNYGATFMDADGFLYAINDATGVVYRITISGASASGDVFTTSIASTNNDGASCPMARIPSDFGDAPDTSPGTGPNDYSTLLANNGPRHHVFPDVPLYLGTQVTTENDAYQNPTATGDDLTKGIQDDGAILPLQTLLTTDTGYSITEYVTNNTGKNAYLYAWVDFNEDGVFELYEAAAGTPIVVPSIPIGIQQVTLTFTVPVGVTLNPDHTFVRVRLTSQLLINQNSLPNVLDTRSLGAAIDGEVEDYYLAVAKPVVRGALFI